EDRERLAFLYRRVAEGQISSASAQVTLRRADGRTRSLQIRATARRDTSGVVRHIDGVAADISREVQEAAVAAQLDTLPPLSTKPQARRRSSPGAGAPYVMEGSEG